MTSIQQRKPRARSHAPVRPTAKLFSPAAILLHSVLGTPVVGAIGVATNWFRLGDKKRGLLSALGGLIAPVFLVAFGAKFFSVNVAVAGLIGAAVGLIFAWHKEQSAVFRSHIFSGGAKANPWPLTVACLVVIGAVGAFVSQNPALIEELEKLIAQL